MAFHGGSSMNNVEPVKEQVKVVETGKPGRPAFSNEQYWLWLEEMRQWLERGNSIYYACSKAGIEKHYDQILEKYKAGGIFSRKIDALRAHPGELVNETLVRLSATIADKVKAERPVTQEEFNVLKLMAEKHRTSQPFFTDRHENAESDPLKVGKILDVLEEQTDYAKLGSTAQGQMVATNTLIQDQGQNGGSSSIQAEQNAVTAHGGEGSSPV